MSHQTSSALTARDQPHGGNDISGDLLSGLRGPQKRISPKYFYDERGSQLFDAICELPEYYLTRTELAIMEANVALPVVGAQIVERDLEIAGLLAQPGLLDAARSRPIRSRPARRS